MTRLLLNLLSILSLLLFTAAEALWVRSHFASDRLLWCPLCDTPDGYVSGEYLLDSRGGILYVGAVRHQHHKVGNLPFDFEVSPVLGADFEFSDEGWTVRAPDGRSDWGFSGWTLNKSRPGRRTTGVGWSTPYWFLLLLFSLPPTLHVVLSRRRRRRRHLGLCPRCGYDLRATPGKCPECGTISPAPPAG